jgi:hypothetical protein
MKLKLKLILVLFVLGVLGFMLVYPHVNWCHYEKEMKTVTVLSHDRLNYYSYETRLIDAEGNVYTEKGQIGEVGQILQMKVDVLACSKD